MPQLQSLYRNLFFIAITMVMAFFPSSIRAQQLLNKKLSVTISNQPLQQALNAISREGGFYFSYNSNVLPGDSIINLNVQQTTVQNILVALLGNAYRFKENGNYIIVKKYIPDGKPFVIKGYIIHAKTGERIPNVSVYDSRQFASALTDGNGYFQLRLHNKTPGITVNVSKIYFNDTQVQLQSGDDQTLTIAISPIQQLTLNPVTIIADSAGNKNRINNFLLSSRQKIRDINLSHFFTKQPFQYSLWPGLGTHGKLSAQVMNKYSFNILGGYTAGVNWFELGGLFNMDKKDVQYVQLAGLFNAVGGHTTGFQGSSMYNSVGGFVKGFQIAGIYNQVEQKVTGVQMAGILNKSQQLKGFQLAGAVNINNTTLTGIQIAGVLNYTHHLKGLQIGLVNISDTSSGQSIGLVNIVKKKGFYKLSLAANEVFPANIAFKSGSPKLYSIIPLSAGFQDKHPFYAFGFGLGKVFNYEKKVSYTTEMTEQSIVGGFKNDLPALVRLQPAIQIQISKQLHFFAGPSFSLFFKGSSLPKYPEMSFMPSHHFKLWRSTFGWFGGTAGITLF